MTGCDGGGTPADGESWGTATTGGGAPEPPDAPEPCAPEPAVPEGAVPATDSGAGRALATCLSRAADGSCRSGTAT
jgi:hypothetical protein